MTLDQEMFVTKRNGQTEELFYDKIIQRLKQLFPNSSIQYSGLVLKIMDQLYNALQWEFIIMIIQN